MPKMCNSVNLGAAGVNLPSLSFFFNSKILHEHSLVFPVEKQIIKATWKEAKFKWNWAGQTNKELRSVSQLLFLTLTELEPTMMEIPHVFPAWSKGQNAPDTLSSTKCQAPCQSPCHTLLQTGAKCHPHWAFDTLCPSPVRRWPLLLHYDLGHIRCTLSATGPGTLLHKHRARAQGCQGRSTALKPEPSLTRDTQTL